MEYAGSDDLQKMFAFMAHEGYQVDIAELHRAYPEIGWHDFAAWAAELDWPAILPAASSGR